MISYIQLGGCFSKLWSPIKWHHKINESSQSIKGQRLGVSQNVCDNFVTCENTNNGCTIYKERP